MTTKLKLLGAAALLILLLTACYNRNAATPGTPAAPRTTPGAPSGPTADQARTYGTPDGTADGMLLTPGANVQLSQEIANQLASLPEVQTANVLVTNNNAYVAVVLRSGTAVTGTGQGTNVTGTTNLGNANTGTTGVRDVSQDVKDKIADKVRSVNPNIRNVYVSANPDFVERMNVFAQEVRNGRPVEGLLNEFNNVIKRVFPSNAGSVSPAGK